MMTFVVVMLALVALAAVGVSVKRRGRAGDRDYRGPAPTGYEGGVARHSGDAGGIG